MPVGDGDLRAPGLWTRLRALRAKLNLSQEQLAARRKKRYRVIFKNDASTPIDAKRVDDLIGRALSPDPDKRLLVHARLIWAFAEGVRLGAGFGLRWTHGSPVPRPLAACNHARKYNYFKYI